MYAMSEYDECECWELCGEIEGDDVERRNEAQVEGARESGVWSAEVTEEDQEDGDGSYSGSWRHRQDAAI